MIIFWFFLFGFFGFKQFLLKLIQCMLMIDSSENVQRICIIKKTSRMLCDIREIFRTDCFQFRQQIVQVTVKRLKTDGGKIFSGMNGRGSNLTDGFPNSGGEFIQPSDRILIVPAHGFLHIPVRSAIKDAVHKGL